MTADWPPPCSLVDIIAYRTEFSNVFSKDNLKENFCKIRFGEKTQAAPAILQRRTRRDRLTGKNQRMECTLSMKATTRDFSTLFSNFPSFLKVVPTTAPSAILKISQWC